MTIFTFECKDGTWRIGWVYPILLALVFTAVSMQSCEGF